MSMKMTKEQFIGMTYDELLSENAKLREQLDTAEHNRVRNAREYARLCHENDRLRALVKVAWLSPSREMGDEASSG